MEMAEVNDLLNTPDAAFDNPCQYLWDLENKSHPLALPDLDQRAYLRPEIAGGLTLTVGRKSLEFANAHTVGKPNFVEFLHGGKGKLTLQLRVDPGRASLAGLIEAVERGECGFAFLEYEESAEKPRDEQQGEMALSHTPDEESGEADESEENQPDVAREGHS